MGLDEKLVRARPALAPLLTEHLLQLAEDAERAGLQSEACMLVELTYSMLDELDPKPASSPSLQ